MAEDLANRRIISACAEDIVALWDNAEVQELLKEGGVFLQDQPGLCAAHYNIASLLLLFFTS